MAKVSTMVKTTEAVTAEIKTKGVLRVQEDNTLVVETDDFGDMNILALIDELNLRNVEVEIKITAKQEVVNEVDPLTV
jgi:hypothetical protein